MNNLLTDSFILPQGQYLRGDVESGFQAPNSAELGLDEFFKQVQVIEKLINKLSRLLKKIKLTHEEANSSDMEAIKQLIEKDIDGATKTALLVKKELKELDEDNLRNRQKPRCGKNSTVDRSRTATTVALKNKLKERVSEFQALREMIQQEYRELARRKFCAVTGNDADEETIEQLMATGNIEQYFQKAIQESGRGQIMTTIGEINERHEAVKELERKLYELNQVCLDLLVLVETQGDMLDNIESHVSSAVNYVQSGVVALQSTKKLKKKSRKWMYVATCLLLLIAAVIVLAMLKPWVEHKHA